MGSDEGSSWEVTNSKYRFLPTKDSMLDGQMSVQEEELENMPPNCPLAKEGDKH